MKKIVLFLLIVNLFSCTDKNAGYEITGVIPKESSAEIKLLEQSNGVYKVIDSVYTNNGEFMFSGKIANPDRYYIQINKGSKYAGFFLENSAIHIEIDKDNLSTPLVKGSKTQNVYDEFASEFNSIYKYRIDSVRKLYKNVKNDSERNVVNNLFDQKNREAVDFIVQFSKEHGNSAATPYIAYRYLYNLVGYNNRDLTSILNSINIQLSNTETYKLYSSWVEKNILVEIGKPFVDFTMNDTTGKPIAVSSIKAKCLLIDFWSSSCGPCREVNPILIKLYNKYKPDGFEIVGVSFDQNKKDWLEAIRKDKINWIQISSLTGWKNQAQDIYDVHYIPQNVLIDDKGIIIAKNLKHEELAERLAQIFPGRH